MFLKAKQRTSTIIGSKPAFRMRSQFFSISSTREATNNMDIVFFSASFLMVCQNIEYSDVSPGRLILFSQRLPLATAALSSSSPKKEINRFIDQYSGAGFDGMIDYKFYKDIWITPDGLVEQEKSEGSACTGGCYEKYSYKPTNPDSILVSSGAWVSFNSNPKYGTKPYDAYREYCNKKYNQPQEGVAA